MSHQGAVGGAGANIKKPDRLEIKTEMSETEWQELLHFWTGYKRDARIDRKLELIRSELQQCCSQIVRSRLFQVERETLNTMTENKLLEAIKKVCVRKQSKISHRNNFFNVVQSPGEAPQSFVANNKAKAALCDFTIKTKCSEACTKDKAVTVSYQEDAVENQLIAGLANPEHRQRILVEADKYPTLLDKVALLDDLYTLEKDGDTDPSSEQRSSYKTERSQAAKA